MEPNILHYVSTLVTKYASFTFDKIPFLDEKVK